VTATTRAYLVWATTGPYPGLLGVTFASTAGKARAACARGASDVCDERVSPHTCRARRFPPADAKQPADNRGECWTLDALGFTATDVDPWVPCRWHDYGLWTFRGIGKDGRADG